MDIDELHKEREKRVEEVYPDFMQDYKIMRDELNSTMSENAELQKQVDELSHENDELEYRAEQLEKQLTKAVKDTAKEIIALIKSQPIMQYDTVIYSLTEAQVRGLQLRFGVEVE